MDPEVSSLSKRRGSAAETSPLREVTQTLESICVLDCPDACTLEVKVADGRVVSIDGGHRNPVTEGYICGKVRSQMVDHMYGEHRLQYPARRVGAKGAGEFERISWDEALDTIAQQLLSVRDQFGGESILPLFYGGSNGLLSQDNTDARLFRRLGASGLATTVCAAPTSSAAGGLYGKMPGVALTDYAHARAIIVWGANPATSGIHLMKVLQEAKRRGAFLAVVDPRRTPVARIADIHLAVRPGTDLPVALSLLRWLLEAGHADEQFLERSTTGAEELRRRAGEWTFDRAAELAGVEASAIAEMGRRYVEASPAVVRCGWGLERNRNGGSAAAAVMALPAVAGKFGVRGGGYTMSNSAAWSLDAAAAACEPENDARVINMNEAGEALLNASDPPVKALFVYNCNPLAILPAQAKVRRGFEREDLFTVVFEQVMTDTARYADILLPATTFLERGELARSYGVYALQRSRKVADPVGESRSNHVVFADLCERTGLAKTGDPRRADDLVAAMLAVDERGAQLGEALAADNIAFPEFGDSPVQFVDVFPRTDDQRVHLVPAELDAEAAATGGLYAFQADPRSAAHPLALISPASKRTISSTFGQLRRGQVPVELHPDDAAARAISNGDEVRMFNELGEVRCRAGINADLRPGVVCFPKGLWDHNTLSGNTGNVLVPDTLTDLGGGACFNDTRVQVARLA